MYRRNIGSLLVFFAGLFVLSFEVPASQTSKQSPQGSSSAKPKAKPAAKPKAKPAAKPRRRASPWTAPTFADSTSGDSVDGEDLVVRLAAVEALGRYNGSVVVVDADTGRVLTIVNQRLALKSGFQPCSIVKIPVGLAGLMEGLIDRDTGFRLPHGKVMNLTEAMARSDNPYFASLGQKLGFERVSYYARLLGLGEKAGLNIEGEEPGLFPDAPPPNGLGMMSSFGSGISLTPLQLASMLSTIANGGTLYYLQYPRSEEEAVHFVPCVKRHLDLAPWLDEITPGLSGAVEFGTARRANYAPNEPVLGKTGTCTENRVRLGWFGSFNTAGGNRLTVVVLLTGAEGASGPTAAQIAGNVYRRLSEQNFFAEKRLLSPAALISTSSCCLP